MSGLRHVGVKRPESYFLAVRSKIFSHERIEVSDAGHGVRATRVAAEGIAVDRFAFRVLR